MKRKKKKISLFTIINTSIMVFVVVVTLFPFIYLVAQSFSSEAAVYAGKVSIFPVDFTTLTYQTILSKPDFFHYYGNTIFYAVTGTIVAVLGTAILTYPLSKKRLRLNKFFIPFVLFTMYFGGGLIPNYILVAKTMNMKDSMLSMIIPGAINAYYVLLMKSFFESLPEELEEAASVDGMNTYGIFIKIVLPLSKPILATMVLFNMVNIWNNWFSASIYLSDKGKWPVALYLKQIIDSFISPTEIGATTETTAQIAATVKSCTMVLTALPIVCIYPFVQKYFVKGMMIGSVKG